MTVNERDWLRDFVKKNEGYRAKPYRCSAGVLTIGYGTNIDDGISKDEAEYLLNHRLTLCLADLSQFSWFHKMNVVRQMAVIDMRYQLGPSRFRGFKKMIAALENKEYATAAKEALDSKYAKLDSPERAKRVAAMLETGEA